MLVCWFHSYILTFTLFLPSHEEILSPKTFVPRKSSTNNAVLVGATMTTNAKISVGAIAGVTAAGIAALALVIFLTLYWHCRVLDTKFKGAAVGVGQGILDELLPQYTPMEMVTN